MIRQGAHPRSRGENWVSGSYPATWQGSSPLTRGKRWYAKRHGAYYGLIPAHAGKTSPSAPGGIASRAHPRSRGENVTINQGWDRLEGSSPLTRGKRIGMTATIKGRGLIPAHAGKTQSFAAPERPRGAHPRSRGENAVLRPPGRPDCGLIPAHAGKTRSQQLSCSGRGAHPRSRGENIAAISAR